MASYEEVLVSISLPADSTLATWTGVNNYPGTSVSNPGGNQYRFVVVNNQGKVVLASATTPAVTGVVQSIPQVAGQAATVGISGVSNVELGATLAAGAYVNAGTNGVAVAAPTGKAIFGQLLQGGSSGELVPMLIRTGVAP